MKKPLSVAPPRLYNECYSKCRGISFKYTTFQEEVLLADALSRAHLPTKKDTDDGMLEDCEVMIHSFLDTLPVSAIKKEQLQATTRQDQTFQNLKRYIEDGWPNEIGNIPKSIRP